MFSKNAGLLAAAGAVGLGGIALATALLAQPTGQGGPGGGARPQPTEEMLAVCKPLAQGDACAATDPGGQPIDGTCQGPQNLPLACVPKGGGGQGGGDQVGGGPPMGQSNSGSKIADTQTYTTGVACTYSVDKLNQQIGIFSKVKWTCERGQRLLVANGIPDHAIGTFPNPANPNAPSEQTVKFSATTSPVAYSGPGGRVKESLMGLNGIKFDPGTGGHCLDSITDPSQCGLGPGSPGQWIVEALGQSSFDFGTDANHAHVQPGGMYHYHGVPEGMLSAKAKQGQEMALIGWAADGFPVYARYGFPRPRIMTDKLKLMQTSYRLKQAPDAGRPPVSLIAMGAFMQDWEYVAGLGDLDECNGRFGSTPEFPEGIYHYYATDSYPYIQRCVKGSIESKPERAQGDRPRGGGQRDGNRRGPPGGQGGGQGRGGGPGGGQ